MVHRLRLWIVSLRTRLWVRPVIFTVVALACTILAAFADGLPFENIVPPVQREALDDLLTVMATIMLTVATFAVASMVAAYGSASSSATPRAFMLVVADDLSKTALSGFIGSFIFSLVALTAVKGRLYGPQGLFVLFCLLAIIFAIVILLFLRWVDNIARLGRLGSTIDRVEETAEASLARRRKAPTLGAAVATAGPVDGLPVHAAPVGYVQDIDIGALQTVAERAEVDIRVEALPGTFVTPDRPVARVLGPVTDADDLCECVRNAFHVDDDRTFEDDPRFGLITLSEIASRALSPAVNDPGTAIDIIGTFVRLFVQWSKPAEQADVRFPRVQVAPLDVRDLFDDAFSAIGRDGATMVEVGVRLQKAFLALDATGVPELREAARIQSARALALSLAGLTLEDDRQRIRHLAGRLSS